jgi:hypothetical protein
MSRIEYVNAIGQAGLSTVTALLNERGYKLVDARPNTGEYCYYPSDGAPGWQEWMYEVAIGMRDGDELKVIFRGVT